VQSPYSGLEEDAVDERLNQLESRLLSLVDHAKLDRQHSRNLVDSLVFELLLNYNLLTF
jgi:hypothetical protein